MIFAKSSYVDLSQNNQQKHDVWITAMLLTSGTAELVEINWKVWFRRCPSAVILPNLSWNWYGTEEARRLDQALPLLSSQYVSSCLLETFLDSLFDSLFSAVLGKQILVSTI